MESPKKRWEDEFMQNTILVSLTMLVLTVLTPSQAWAVRFSTYLEGTVVQKTASVMVINSERGTYWIDIEKRPVSYTRSTGPDRIGFWVAMDQIKRFRPAHSETVKSRPAVGPLMIAKKKTPALKRRAVAVLPRQFTIASN